MYFFTDAKTIFGLMVVGGILLVAFANGLFEFLGKALMFLLKAGLVVLAIFIVLAILGAIFGKKE